MLRPHLHNLVCLALAAGGLALAFFVALGDPHG